MAIKKTLLELVQGILEDIGGDEVNSITDTEESETVAGHIRKVYENLVSHTEWLHTRRLTTLTPRGDTNFPTHLVIPENIKKIECVNYNIIKTGETKKNYAEIAYLESDKFLVKLNTKDSTQSNIRTIIDDGGVELLIQDDKYPEYWTSFDDNNIVFDSYDSAVDTTIQESKLQVQAYIIPAFEMTDGFTPNLPPDAFSLLREEATTRCQLKMREFQDVVSSAEARKQSRFMSRNQWVSDGGIKYENFGRTK